MSAKVAHHLCPECGIRTKHVTPYQDGSFLFIHKQRLVTTPFPHYKVIEACNSRKPGVTIWIPT